MKPEHLDLLREALPYIRRFKDKIFVIKLSGHVCDDPEKLRSVSQEVALIQQVGVRVVLVHGGGKQLNDLASRLGMRQRIVEGRRVTDDDTLEIAKMVFGGKINTDILALLRSQGARPVGLSGLDGNLLHARKREIQRVIDSQTGDETWVDYGHVGEIVEIDGRLLRLLLGEGYLPVISSLGADESGNIYNINADTIAAEIAVDLQAEKLVLLSNVDGIYRVPGEPATRISQLSLKELEDLIRDGTLTGGMLPKAASISSLLKRGVGAAHILDGRRHNALLQEVFTDAGAGTMISRGEG